MTLSSALFFSLTVYGLSAVICFFVALLIKGVAVSLNFFEAAPAPQTVELTPPSPSQEITPELVAVITAAVTTALGKKAHIMRIQSHTGDATWARQGRVSIMTSHRTKH
jgi:Na+-transporting methylmalonyl-CoA/oxaloacetate decarboxylase gamma subunit